jgi:peroxiredoxin
MKKIALLLFTVFCVVSCKNSTFTITGSLENKSENGKTIYVKERINREWKTIDSTVVENQKFSFKGNIDTAKIAFLSYITPTNQKVRQAFVLENGKISVSIDTTGFMTFKGTPQNDLLQTYQDEKHTFNKKAEAFFKSHNDSIKTPEQKTEIANKIDELNQEETRIDKKYATNQVNTLVGTYIFTNSFYEMNLDEKEAITGLMNAETKKIKRIQEIMTDIEVEKKVAVGRQFTDFKLPALLGGTLALSDLVGKTDFIMVDFWASWCGPCMQYLPQLQAFYAKYQGPHFEILGVSLDDNKDAWADAVTTHKIKWKLVSDLKGWKCEGARTYAVNSIPCTFFIDKSGKIVGKNLSIPQMETFLNKKMAKK